MFLLHVCQAGSAHHGLCVWGVKGSREGEWQVDSFGFRVELQGLRGSTIPQVIRERGRASLGLALVCLCLRVRMRSREREKSKGVSILVFVTRWGWPLAGPHAAWTSPYHLRGTTNRQHICFSVWNWWSIVSRVPSWWDTRHVLIYKRPVNFPS